MTKKSQLLTLAAAAIALLVTSCSRGPSTGEMEMPDEQPPDEQPPDLRTSMVTYGAES